MRRIGFSLASPARVLLATFSAVLLNGCGGRDEVAPTLESVKLPEPAGAPLPSGTPEQLEADSSLSVKRGVVTLTSQTRGIRLCGGNVDLTLTDQLDGALDRVYAESGGKPLYVEVYGERGDADAASTFNIEDLLFASIVGNEGCTTPLGKYELLARGSDPTWAVEVRGDSMVLRQTSAPTEISFASVETADAEGTVTYRAGADRHVLELVITQRGCRDAVANEYYAYTATARLDKQTLNGCARVGE